ncbi:MAG TPA: hypothetical protein VEU96_19050 [Bryobacteraceae bacterium]|nr:hypothetical protein [Bryobacteraceae bacterium]
MALFASLALAQGDRRQWDANFLSHRPAGQANHVSVKSYDDAYLGITVWRLRPSVPSDNPAVRMKLEDGQEWTPERVSSRNALSSGDRIRISVETARPGYLYVLGDKYFPRVIFPSGTSDNYVAPGTMVMVPSDQRQPAYFKFSKYETFTVLLAPQPVPRVAVESMPDRIGPALFADWQTLWGNSVSRLGPTFPGTQPITAAEARSRQLTQDEPLPQDIYHSDVQGEPILADIEKSLIAKSTFGTGMLGGISNRRSPDAAPTPTSTSPLSRITESSLLTPAQEEKPGYGLYSYVLFGAPPDSFDSNRWHRYYQTILAFLTLPPANAAEKYVPPPGLNLTFLPVTLSAQELPAIRYLPIQFHFDPERMAAHVREHQAGGKPFAGHGSSNGDNACMLVSSYDYARAQKLLSMLPGPHLEGPYIVSVEQPLGQARSLPAHYLYQDLSSVPPELVNLWFKEFMVQAQEAEFWKTRSREQFILRLRTVIGIASQQVPDFRSTVTWAFIAPPRK